MVIDFINGLESIHNQTIRNIIKSIAIVIATTFCITIFLMGILLILYPIVIWFGHKIDWLGISYENGNVLGKVFMSWISIGIGIWFIKMALGKD